MAKAKLHQIKLQRGDDAAHPPFPGGWVATIFEALNSFNPALANKHQLPISPRTQDRIKAAEEIKRSSYDEIEEKLVELIAELFPNVSTVNGFVKKYVDEYFCLWKRAAEIAPIRAKNIGFKPGESYMLGRALFRDLVLRLCYLESCERVLNNQNFCEEEIGFLRYDSPNQLYQALISNRVQSENISQEKLAGQLGVNDRMLRRIKQGQKIPECRLLLKLKPLKVSQRLLAGVGFVDRLLKELGFKKSILRNEFLAIASVFFRNHPAALETFIGSIPRKKKRGATVFKACGFEDFVAFGDQMLLHCGFDKLYSAMLDSLWRAHLYTLQFARITDLTEAYIQHANNDSDEPLENFLDQAECESNDCSYNWMQQLHHTKKDNPSFIRKKRKEQWGTCLKEKVLIKPCGVPGE
ncbi:MAG: hypothetical protein SFY92_08665 [Verrucomicrobiae bacterium]|nr:hypothetical protein [Verrucomicrobiae bacterium]